MKKKSFFITVLISISASILMLVVYINFFDNKNELIKAILDQGSEQIPTKNVSLNLSNNLVDFTKAAEKSLHAVVHIKTKINQQYYSNPLYDFFFGTQPKQYNQVMPLASGSGVIVSQDGYIVTNYHVIKNAEIIDVTLNDKRKYQAKVVGFDEMTDVALLKIDADKLPFLPYGNSDNLKIGQWVLAIGNPFNLTSTVTAGIVSAKARDINIMSKYGIEAFIQTDAAVNPGNSGGALVNTNGELVGINTAIASNTGSYTGYSFAIPVNIVKKVVADLIKYGKVQRAFLGASIIDLNADIAKYLGVSKTEGVYIYDISPNGAAERAGLKKGDIIEEINGVKVNSLPQLQEQLAIYSPKDEINIIVLRNSKKIAFTLKLSESF